MPKKIYDIVGIGIGPFNLGLAALCHTIPELGCLFIDKKKEFNWHPGLMIPGTRMQIPFYADLVTLADPCSPFNYMSFLKAKQRLFRFGICENYFITRKEYNQYCHWVAGQLPSLTFNCECRDIFYHEKEETFQIFTSIGNVYAKKIIIGIGTNPNIPKCAKKLANETTLHSGDYLFHKESLLKKEKITIVGSGQSAAEIFMDLLQNREQFTRGLYWFTRSDRFFPMDYSQLTLEMSTPDYIDHFYSLQNGRKMEVLSGQDMLYKGINASLISEIYNLLYQQESEDFKNPVKLFPNCDLIEIQENQEKTTLKFRHTQLNKCFQHSSQAVIFATGYHNEIPNFLNSLKNLIQWSPNGSYLVNRNYSIDNYNSIFVQNAESHTHGFNAADLSLGPYRNAVILNTILKIERFKIEKNICFQNFGTP